MKLHERTSLAAAAATATVAAATAAFRPKYCRRRRRFLCVAVSPCRHPINAQHNRRTAAKHRRLCEPTHSMFAPRKHKRVHTHTREQSFTISGRSARRQSRSQISTQSRTRGRGRTAHLVYRTHCASRCACVCGIFVASRCCCASTPPSQATPVLYMYVTVVCMT